MHYKVVGLAFAIVVAPVSGQAINDVSTPGTTGRFLAEIPISMSRPLVDHCLDSVPSLSAELQSEYSSFLARFSIAIEPMLERLSSDPKLAAPVPVAMKEQFGEIAEMMLSEVKKVDPDIYCPNLIVKMRSATSETIRKSIEDSFRMYESNAQSKKETQ